MRLLQRLALICCSCLSCCPRFLSQPAEEPDAGEGGRRRAGRVQAQDVSMGRGLLAEGQRAAPRKQQVNATFTPFALLLPHWDARTAGPLHTRIIIIFSQVRNPTGCVTPSRCNTLFTFGYVTFSLRHLQCEMPPAGCAIR